MKNLQIDSVAQTVTLTTLAWFLSSGLTTVSGWPVPGGPVSYTSAASEELTARPTTVSGWPVSYTSAASEELTTWPPSWVDRCDSRRRRHVGDGSRRRAESLITRLNMSLENFRNMRGNFTQIYSNVSEDLDKQFKFEWLSDHALDCKGCPHPRLNTILLAMLNVLQRFWYAFHYLKAYKLKNGKNIILLRDPVIEKVQGDVLAILCEVKTAIQEDGQQLPPSPEWKPAKWAKLGDQTQLQIQDWGVLQEYNKTLEEFDTKLRVWKDATTHRNRNKGGKYVKRPMRGNKRPGKGRGKKQRGPGKKFPGARLSGKLLPDGTLPGKRFPDGTLPGKRFPDGTLPGKKLPNGRLSGKKFPGGRLSGKKFPGGRVPGNLRKRRINKHKPKEIM